MKGKHRPTVARVDLMPLPLMCNKSRTMSEPSLKYAVVKANAYGHG